MQKFICKSLNLVILNLHEWFTNNRLILNIDKTKVLPYKDANIINSISINSTEICLVSHYTFLGVILDNNLNFKEHIRKIEIITCYLYIKKAELFTNIYFKAALQFFVLASYHVGTYCLEMWDIILIITFNVFQLYKKRLFEL